MEYNIAIKSHESSHVPEGISAKKERKNRKKKIHSNASPVK